MLALFLQGCTKDKAEAIKVAAENLRVDASAALSQIRGLLKANTAMPPRDDEELVADLQERNFTYEMLQTLLSEDQIGEAQSVQIDQRVEAIEQQYETFARMFDSLPQGYFFAKKAVEPAERHAVNLTVQMINLAKLIEEKKIPVRLNAKRILLVEQVKQHNAITDEPLKRTHLKHAAQQITALAIEETQLREQAIARCLQAAEAGRLVMNLIRDYKTLSVAEILAQTQQSLGFVAEISGQNPDVVSLLNRFQAVESTIRTDPYWSRLLDEWIQPPAP
jgi:hypothetical protein